MEWQIIDEQVKQWMFEARKMILASFDTQLDINTKSNRNDLVTNMDKKVERFYVDHIHNAFPDAKIMGEESQKDSLSDADGLFFVVDPIDGTMNFVKQKDHFASMIAVYQNHKPLIGYILDVRNNDLYWGGKSIGVYKNFSRMTPPDNIGLREGLLGIGLPLLLNNEYHIQNIVHEASGVRMYGSAGIEFIHVLTGKTVGYVSRLHAWDYAAGKILAEGLGLVIESIDGTDIDVLSSKVVLVSTKSTNQKINQMINA